MALGPNSFLASSNAFLKFVLYFGKPEDLAILNTEDPYSLNNKYTSNIYYSNSSSSNSSGYDSSYLKYIYVGIGLLLSAGLISLIF